MTREERAMEYLELVEAYGRRLPKPDNPWVRTAERPPTKDDATKDVFVYDDVYKCCDVVSWWVVADKPKKFIYWMPIPPLPEVGG